MIVIDCRRERARLMQRLDVASTVQHTDQFHRFADSGIAGDQRQESIDFVVKPECGVEIVGRDPIGNCRQVTNGCWSARDPEYVSWASIGWRAGSSARS